MLVVQSSNGFLGKDINYKGAQMFHDLIKHRRSIRKYLPKPVEQEKIDLLITAALHAPSSRSIKPCEFVVVTDPLVLADLACAKPHGAIFIKDAAVGIVICADPHKCDVWIEDATIASIFVHLAATSLGLGSCWIQIRKRDHDQNLTAHEHIAKRLNLPSNLVVEAMIAVGYPDETKGAHPEESLQFEKVFFNMYGQRQ